MTVAGIGQHYFSRMKLESRELLAGILTPRRRQFEVITFQRRQSQAVVDAPLSSGLARFLHCGRIPQPHGSSPERRFQIDSVFLPQLLAHLSQPILCLA